MSEGEHILDREVAEQHPKPQKHVLPHNAEYTEGKLVVAAAGPGRAPPNQVCVSISHTWAYQLIRFTLEWCEWSSDSAPSKSSSCPELATGYQPHDE